MNEVIDNPSISARYQGVQEELGRQKWEDLSVRQRLLRRALEENATVDVGTADEPIPIAIRVPMKGEIDRLLAAEAALMGKRGDPETVAAYSREICEIVGGLCRDPELGPGFWLAGEFPTWVIPVITEAAAAVNAERVKDARAFRLAGERARLPAALRVPGEAPS